MSITFSRTIRFLLVPVVMWRGFIVYGISIDFFATAIPLPKDKSLIFGALLAQGFLAAATVSLLFSYPIAFLYRRKAVAIAVAMSIPVLVIRLPEILDFSRHPYAIAISGYEVLAYAVLLIIGTLLVNKHLSHSDNSFERARSYTPLNSADRLH